MAFRVDANVGRSTASAQGNFQRIITDNDALLFGLHPNNALRSAVGRMRGRDPTNAWVRAPANVAGVELYSRYGWPESRTHIEVLSANILVSPPHQVVAARSQLVNNSSITVNAFANLTNSNRNSVTTWWSQTHGINISQSVSYSIGLVEGETSFSYSYEWGQGGEQTQESTVSLVQGMSVDLPPRTAVEVILLAMQHHATVQVTYRQRSSGSVAQNYNPTFEGHHFWHHPINNVISAINNPTTRTITTTLNIGTFASGRVEINDLATGAPLATSREGHKLIVREAPQFSLNPITLPKEPEVFHAGDKYDQEHFNEEDKQGRHQKLN